VYVLTHTQKIQVVDLHNYGVLTSDTEKKEQTGHLLVCVKIAINWSMHLNIFEEKK
jgi:hypothetical protein